MKNFLRMCLENLIRINILLFFCVNSSGQTVEETFRFAEKKYLASDFKLAAGALQRVVFFDKGIYRAKGYQYLGACYEGLHQYEKAVTLYDLAYFAESDDSIKLELVFKKTAALLQMGEFNAAIAELLSIEDEASVYAEDKRSFYLGIAHFGLGNLLESEKYFLKTVDSDSVAQSHIRFEFQATSKSLRHSEKLAKILSMIIPGAGQAYSGDIKSALNSLLLNAAFISLGYFIAKSYTPLDATLAVFPWFQRYYTGGIKKSGIIAVNKQNEKRNRAYQNILGIIEASK